MNDSLSISVVIPLYNKAKTIQRAIASVQKQGVLDIEIIVIDDGSTDASARIVEDLDDPRVILIRQVNTGPGGARNVGAAKAHAPLIAFLDADDEWQDGFIEAGIAALNAYPAAIAYCCGYDAGTANGIITNRVAMITSGAMLRLPPVKSIGAKALMDHLDGLHSSSTIVRRSAFEATGGFYDRERCLWGEDSYFWAQILFMGPIFWDPTPRTYYHVEDSSLGPAITRRERPRPLAEHTEVIALSLASEHRAALRVLARAIASGDAAMLADSGFFARSLALRCKHRMFNVIEITRDGLKYLRRKLLGPSL